MTNKFGLIILDGWGIGDTSKSDAVFSAKTPVFDQLLKNYPNTTLTTFGEDVGLPEGQMGNSEVGHMNIGAGRIVYQELTRINLAIRDKSFFSNEILCAAFKKAAETNQNVHFIGLLSDGGVHSHTSHLRALVQMAEDANISRSFIHAFTDGRDCDPKSAADEVKKLQTFLQNKKTKLASIIGRYFAMDRDKRWERIQLAYDLIVNQKGTRVESFENAILDSYQQEITDEFLEPIYGPNFKNISNGDLVICFNYRTDRPRQITEALTQEDFPAFSMKPLLLDYLTMTNYNDLYKNVKVIFEKDNLTHTLGEMLAKYNRTQVRIAETEKYPHVTFFFNGGREKPFEGETRIVVDSPKVATYDLAPSMSAHKVTEKIIESMQTDHPDFFCLNFANPDMVGHTGVYKAIIEACETVDECLGKIVKRAQAAGYELLIIADHGNADLTINSDGTPNTAHTLNPVPAILVSNDDHLTLRKGKLADVAPTIMARMGLAEPLEMNGDSLLVEISE
jgi:2,3-bisphosphoglycerate-independent phosphoglycerate mutase